MAHTFHFFRTGAVDQVSVRDADDLRGLLDLDPKLWVALAMPTRDVDIDAATLDAIDEDKDGRIRIADIQATIKWIIATFKNPNDVLKGGNALPLASIADAKVVAAAQRMLANLNKAGETSLSVDDAAAVSKTFADTVLNGDSIVIAESSDDADTQKAITDAIACTAAVTDRSGKPGLDQAHADEFFAEIDKRAAWLAAGKQTENQPLGEKTQAAVAALTAVQAKIEDFFTRCRLAAYDARAQAAMSGQEADLVAMATQALHASSDEIAKLPLAKITPEAKLPLGAGTNPAWATRMNEFYTAAIEPIVGAKTEITADDVTSVVQKLAAAVAWLGAKPATKVDALDEAWVTKLSAPAMRDAIKTLIAKDAALADEYGQIAAVEKAVRVHRDFGRVLRNFANFSDFYSKQNGAFQCGTLYLDGRAMKLCIPVSDAGKHGALAAAADACLVYCDIKRGSEAKQIVAALTNGDSDNVFVGRNGVFYDRAGNDWDATVAKIVANPISIREAFWSPYKKAVKLIEGMVTKRAQAADAAADAKMQAASTAAANADKAAADAAAKPPAGKKIDLGTVAAIGVAVGGVGTLVGALLSAIFGLGKWLPLGLLAILLMISGPSMLLAWLKLRRRNLGPILDANGWAINGRARINVSFGAKMTELAELPRGATRSFDDPYADKKSPWKLYLFLIVVLVLAGSWYVGKLDSYLPEKVKSVSVLGKSAPAYKAPPAAPAEASPAPAPAPAAPAPAAPAAK